MAVAGCSRPLPGAPRCPVLARKAHGLQLKKCPRTVYIITRACGKKKAHLATDALSRRYVTHARAPVYLGLTTTECVADSIHDDIGFDTLPQSVA